MFCVFSRFEIISLALFVVPPIVCGGLLVLGPCFVLQYFVHSLVLQSIHCVREGELFVLLLLCSECRAAVIVL